MAKSRGARRTVAEETFEVMRRFGVDRIFGNPGSTEMSWFRHWPDDLGYVLCLQEASVVAMAEGYAIRSGKPGMVNLHSAAGIGNGMASIMTAWRNQSPLVITAGNQARALLPVDPYLGQIYPTEFPKPYVKWADMPARGADVPGALARAFLTAMTPPCGPAFVTIPSDDWEAEAEPVLEHTVAPGLGADPAAIADFAKVLAGAKHPAIVLGQEVDRDGAGPGAVRLAEKLKAAVYVAPWASRCCFPEEHPLFQGYLAASREHVRETLDGHDVVLVIGAQVFTYHVWTPGPYLSEGTTLLHITENPTHAFSAPLGASVIASAGNAIRALTDALTTTVGTAPKPRAKPATVDSDAKPMQGAYALKVLREMVPPDSPVFEEVPSFRETFRDQFRIAAPGLYYNGFSGGLGWALPASVGGALATPDRKTVAVLGDGSMMYSIQALWTAAQQRAPLTVIVINNGEYGAMKSFATLFDIPAFPAPIQHSLDLPRLDFPALATSMGVPAMQADEPSILPDMLEQAMADPGPVLIDVHVEPLRGVGPL
ncbi:benzoylformate decarboxylase [Nocardia sp. NPDC127526]|uniref:benzoylformate decarboxylase n=1 Tax=Nocardia sp. NPDC127526 TaxID=3345393 RepID=UPI0036286A70